MATIRDVAQLAGVSISTVSRVLNGYPRISEDAKRSVFNAIEDLNYSPNTRGRGSQKSNNKMILVVSTSPKPEICSGICDAARDMGYDTLLTNTTPNSVGAYTKYVEDGLISGIILLNIRLLAEFSDSLPVSCPIVSAMSMKMSREPTS
jgi:DNA-binding LacI/PurR family transcriptional regulator